MWEVEDLVNNIKEDMMSDKATMKRGEIKYKGKYIQGKSFAIKYKGKELVVTARNIDTLRKAFKDLIGEVYDLNEKEVKQSLVIGKEEAVIITTKD